MARNPKLPSAEAVEIHNRTHTPYRDWCRWCTMGRGRGQPHVQQSKSEIPIIGLDYFFITADGLVKKRKDLDYAVSPNGDTELEADRNTGKLIKCILIRCFQTKFIFAHVVPCKGVDEEGFVTNLVVQDLMWLGHLELILKGDNEPSLQAQIDAIHQP